MFSCMTATDKLKQKGGKTFQRPYPRKEVRNMKWFPIVILFFLGYAIYRVFTSSDGR